MKTLLILAYIITVLALSGMVKADGALQSVEINPNTGIIDVSGYLPDSCYRKPSLAAAQIDETKNSVNMVVNSEKTKKMFCAEHTVPFAITYDLKELHLNSGKTYNIHFANLIGNKKDLAYTALPKNTSAASYELSLQEFKGTLVYVSNPLDPQNLSPALKRANQVVLVISPDMSSDLKKFENQEVHVSGYAVQTADLDNDPLFQSQTKAVTAIIPVSVSHF